MKTLQSFLFLVLTLNFVKVFSQDTIYCDAYPKGIVVPTIDMNDYSKVLHPINNSNLKLIIPKKQVIKIASPTGIKYVNNEYSQSSGVVIPSDQLTGKVNYIGIIDVPGATKKKLYNALKTLPSANVQYNLVSSDDSESSFLQYTGKFNARFAGDLYDVVFTLTVKFKDGKIKYDYHDFMFCFEEIKEKNRANLTGGSYSIATKYRVANPLEQYYIPGYRNDKFWMSISVSMEEALKTLNKTCTDFATDKDGF